jgi:hypothetical protein
MLKKKKKAGWFLAYFFSFFCAPVAAAAADVKWQDVRLLLPLRIPFVHLLHRHL